MTRFFQEPLVHFLAAGLALFLVFGLANRNERTEDANVVNVDHDALLTFIQYRIKVFDATLAEKKLESMSDEELQQLIDDYVREEVLHREALALGLDEDDYVIRRRLVQKLEFITEGFVEAAVDLDDAALRRYFDAHKSDYFVEPYVTFTHIYFDTEDHTRDQAWALAEKKLAELNRDGVPFTDAPQHGDRFLYHVNYVERTPDYVASHFGVPMARALFELEPNDFTWRGPFDSPYGVHLVMLTTNQPGRDAELAEIEGRVREDARRAMIRDKTEATIADIVASYEVRVELERAAAPASQAETGVSR
ncbi:MAG: peptidyl-prolyl cis-trans isomerase [Polyangiales bacterium]